MRLFMVELGDEVDFICGDHLPRVPDAPIVGTGSSFDTCCFCEGEAEDHYDMQREEKRLERRWGGAS